jgi:hypothetical protein
MRAATVRAAGVAAALSLAVLASGGTATGSSAKLYPVSKTVVRAACKGAYTNVGAHGPIHYVFTRTSGTCSFAVTSQGLAFTGIVKITKPGPCTYRIDVTVTHAGKVVNRQPPRLVKNCL